MQAPTMTRSGRSPRCRDRSLVYLNNRYHHPALATFISVDPLVTLTGEAYVYGSANPATFSDPSGLCKAVRIGFCTINGAIRQVTPSLPPPSPTRPPESLPTVADAIGRFTAPPGISLIPGAPPRPDDPLQAALWDLMYGPMDGDSSFVGALSDTLDAVAPFVAGGALVVCVVGSAGVCGAVSVAAAAYSVVNNVTACVADCENLGDISETLAKSGVDVSLALLPAPNGPVSSSSLRRLVEATGGSEAWATEVFRNRRVVVSFVGVAASNEWDVP